MRRIYIKRIYYILIILGVYSTNLFASTLSSTNYILTAPEIVPSGGQASSANYSIKHASIGKVFGGMSASANYSLNANYMEIIEKEIPPNPPTLNPVTTPTNNSNQTLSGTKQKYTSIYITHQAPTSIKSYETPLTNETTWSYTITLSEEGDNIITVKAKNKYGLESDPAAPQTIVYDITPPLIIITSPLDSTIVYTNPITLEGTIDGVPFSEQINLNFGPNTITKDDTDGAGNSSATTVEVYLIREPLAPPQTPAQ